MAKFRALIAALLLLLSTRDVAECFELTVLHVNDIHVRMEETSEYSGACKEADKGELTRSYI